MKFILSFLIIYAVLFSIPASAQSADTSLIEETVTKINDSSVYAYVDEWPSFPGGNAQRNKFLSENVRYPKNAEKLGVEGRVIVGFTVEKNGTVSDVKILKGVYPSLDEESVRVVKSMPRWQPGKIKGQPVKCKFKIDFIFKIPEGRSLNEAADTTIIYSYLENWPQFSGGKKAQDRFIKENLRYPLKKKGVEGKAIVAFIVERDGTLSQLKIIKSLSPELDQEALRVVSIMPKWIPATLKDKTVRCMYKVEIIYK